MTSNEEATPNICLIVEDSILDQEKMRRILTRSFNNIKVEVASTIKEAREKLNRFKTSLILLDNNLPDGKGANLALEIAQTGKHSHVPMIIVSDWPSPFMFDKAQSAGISQVVDKADFGARHIHAAFAEKIKQSRANFRHAVTEPRTA
jgi:PleD family two-component response regulator